MAAIARFVDSHTAVVNMDEFRSDAENAVASAIRQKLLDTNSPYTAAPEQEISHLVERIMLLSSGNFSLAMELVAVIRQPPQSR